LNAFSAPQLIAYIEDRLRETGVRGKIIPPDPVVQATARDLARAAVARQVQQAIETLLPIDRVTDRLQDQFSTPLPLGPGPDMDYAGVHQAPHVVVTGCLGPADYGTAGGPERGDY
jgi:hypothetical protein